MPTPRKLIGKDGAPTWQVRWREPDGRQTSITYTDEDAAIKLARYLDVASHVWRADILGAPQALDATTLRAWVPQYIADLTRAEPGTRLEYQALFDRNFDATLGHLPLASITRQHVAKAVNGLTTRLGDKSIQNAHGFLSGAMGGALLAGLITENPCHGIKLPRNTDHERGEMRFLTHAEFERVWAHVPAHYRPLVAFHAGTGCRPGESVVVQVGDVDRDAWTVRFARASKWMPGSARPTGPTKTKRSKRTVVMPSELHEMLDPLLNRGRNEPLFTAYKGGPVSARRFTQQVWNKARDAAKLDDPQPRFYDLRHTHVAWLISAGVSIAVISRRLGHESIKTTMDVYGHLLPDVIEAAGEAAGSVFRGIKPGPLASESPRQLLA